MTKSVRLPGRSVLRKGDCHFVAGDAPIYGGQKCRKRGILAEIFSRFDLVLVSFFTRSSPVHENTPIYGQALFEAEVKSTSFTGQKRVVMSLKADKLVLIFYFSVMWTTKGNLS